MTKNDEKEGMPSAPSRSGVAPTEAQSPTASLTESFADVSADPELNQLENAPEIRGFIQKLQSVRPASEVKAPPDFHASVMQQVEATRPEQLEEPWFTRVLAALGRFFRPPFRPVFVSIMVLLLALPVLRAYFFHLLVLHTDSMPVQEVYKRVEEQQNSTVSTGLHDPGEGGELKGATVSSSLHAPREGLELESATVSTESHAAREVMPALPADATADRTEDTMSTERTERYAPREGLEASSVGILVSGGRRATLSTAQNVRYLDDENVTSENIVEVLKPKSRGLKPVSTKKLQCAAYRQKQKGSRGITPVEPAADVVAIPVLFAFNSAKLSPDATKNLDALAGALNSGDLASCCFRLEGHTDSIGSDAYNATLSKQRAQSVKRYLSQKYQIDAKRLFTVGYGESKPIADNGTEEGRQKNRRIEIVNLGYGQPAD